MDQVEAVAKAIWESQRQLTHKDGFAHKRVWRDKSVPVIFWEGYIRDAKAALAEIDRNRANGVHAPAAENGCLAGPLRNMPQEQIETPAFNRFIAQPNNR